MALNLTLYILRRATISVPVLLVGSFLTFLLVAGLGDPLAELRTQPGTDAEAIAALSHQLGLDKPVVARYFDWLGAFVSGDWGISIAQGAAMEPVFPKVTSAFWVTVRLVLGAEILAFVLGGMVGVLAAVRQYRLTDHVATGMAFLLFSMPIFCVAIVLKQYAIDVNTVVSNLGLGEWLGEPWLRTTSPENLEADGFVDLLAKYVGTFLLPTLSIMTVSFAAYSRFQRASMLETLHMDYIRTATAKGLSSFRIIVFHAFRNALIPVVTLFSVNFSAVVTGAIITERVFNWNGMGTVLVEALNKNDPNVMMGWFMLIAVSTVVANLIADVMNGVLDPRIRVG